MRPDGAIAAVMEAARLQDGAISYAQLAGCGMRRGAVAHRVRTGWLRRIHRGVFLVGPVAGPRAYEHAALLACGEGGVVSHASAAALWRFRPARVGTVEVTLTAAHRRPRRGIAVHRAQLRPDEIRHAGALRVTSPARTLLDLAATLPWHELELAANEAQVLGLTTPAEVRALLDATPRRPGVAAVRAAFADAPRVTRSELERRMRALARRVGLPIPRTQVRLLRYTVDFLWERERVVVEVDGFRAHGTRLRFETDRERDAALVAAGYRVLRFTWRQLVEQPEVVAARLAVVLARAA
jgi:very-short-patch-repair endonuclease